MKSKKVEQMINEGIELYKANQIKKSCKVFTEILSEDPYCVDAHFYMANIFHIQGQLGKAVKAFNKVLELDPGHTDASISLSVILNDIGRYEDAQKIFEKANSSVKDKGVQDPHINKKFADKHYELAEMYFSYNRYDEALFEYNKAAALDAENLEIRIKTAKVYSKKGYISKAFEELRKLKAERPDYIPARMALGLLHYGKGNTIEAQSEWQSALMKDPANEELQMYLTLSSSAKETNLHIE